MSPRSKYWRRVLLRGEYLAFWRNCSWACSQVKESRMGGTGILIHSSFGLGLRPVFVC